MRVRAEAVRELRFDDGTPVRAASAIARFGDGWLIAQDDATAAAWRRPSSIRPVRVLPAIEGLEVFSEAAGTKHLKPDFEAACEVDVDGAPAVLLLGSGSTGARMRSSLVREDPSGPAFASADLAPLYARVAQVLQVGLDALNMEGACRLGDRVRWFCRGNPAAGIPSASVDVELDGLVAAALGQGPADAVRVEAARRYEMGEVDGVALAVTDAAALPDGRVLLSAAAEDTPNAVDDGPVVACALALVDGADVLALAELPTADGTVHKVEGLGLVEADARGVRLLAVVDADDPLLPSVELDLRVSW